MQKQDKTVLGVQAGRANREHYHHWETRLLCSLEGYRIQAIADMPPPPPPSTEYKNFAPVYGFEHITTSSYWPCSNGEVQVAVNRAKTVLNKPDDLYMALLNTHNTQPRGHSPLQRLMGRRTRSLLPLSYDLLKPVSADLTTVSSQNLSQ